MFASAIKLAKLTATLSRGSQRLVRAQQHGMFPLSSRHRCSHRITCPNRQRQEKVLAKSKKAPLDADNVVCPSAAPEWDGGGRC